MLYMELKKKNGVERLSPIINIVNNQLQQLKTCCAQKHLVLLFLRKEKKPSNEVLCSV